MEITGKSIAKAFVGWFKEEDQELEKEMDRQHNKWIEWKKDLESGKKVISPKDMPGVIANLKEVNKKYDKIIEDHENFNKSHAKQMKKVNADQKKLREDTLRLEEELGGDYLTSEPLFRAILGMDIE